MKITKRQLKQLIQEQIHKQSGLSNEEIKSLEKIVLHILRELKRDITDISKLAKAPIQLVDDFLSSDYADEFFNSFKHWDKKNKIDLLYGILPKYWYFFLKRNLKKFINASNFIKVDGI